MTTKPSAITHLFEKISEVLELPVTMRNDEFGNVVLEAKDKIDVHQAEKIILEQQIANKLLLIEEMDKSFVEGDDSLLNKYLLLDDLWKHKRELLQLNIEYVAKDYYIKKYEGKLRYSEEQIAKMIERAKKENPLLVAKAEKTVKDSPELITKNNAILIGLVERYKQGIKTDNEELTFFTEITKFVNL